MKALAATRITQGTRKNGFCFCAEGELVFQGSRCDSGSVDDRCGCYRSLTGVDGLKATTTMKVIEVPISLEEWAHIVASAQVRGGWGTRAEMLRSALTAAHRMQRGLARIPVGTVLELRDDTLVQREITA